MEARIAMDFSDFKNRNNSLSRDPEFARVLAKHGFALAHPTKSVGGVFSPHKMTLKVAVVDADPSSAAETAAAKNSAKADAFTTLAASVGLQPTDLHRNFRTRNGEVFEVIGFNPGNPKNCISLKRVSDGKSFKCSPEFVKSGTWV